MANENLSELGSPLKYREQELFDGYNTPKTNDVYYNEPAPTPSSESWKGVNVEMRSPFELELAKLLNKYSKDFQCSIPDYLLAEYISNCINALGEMKYKE